MLRLAEEQQGKFRKQLEDAQASFQKQMSELQHTIQGLNTERLKLQTQLAALKEEQRLMESKHQGQAVTDEALQKEVAECRSQQAVLKATVGLLQSERDSAVVNLAELQAEMDLLRTQKQAIEVQIDDLVQAASKCNDEQSSLVDQIRLQKGSFDKERATMLSTIRKQDEELSEQITKRAEEFEVHSRMFASHQEAWNQQLTA